MKNLNKALFIVTLISTMITSAKGAIVEWDVSQVFYNSFNISGSDYYFTIGRPFLNICADIVGSGLLLTAENSSNMESGNTFAIASKGDVVSREYMDAKGEYFHLAECGNPDVRKDYSILLDGSENIYLAFIADYARFETPRYGWVELGLDDDGLLKAYSSAWDIDGDSIVVGAVPEPTSGLLLLLGVSILTLRRRS
jgi:hypothetical protein